MVKKLGLTMPDRTVAMRGLSLLGKAGSATAAGLYVADQAGQKMVVELTSTVLDTIRTVLEQVAKHDEVLLINPEAELSPEQAAKILGISRPMVYQRMDGGQLPFREVGAHRRVLMADVLKLKEFEERRREFARALSEDTEDLEQNYAPAPF
jgi:excisionase family DNA binding protein